MPSFAPRCRVSPLGHLSRTSWGLGLAAVTVALMVSAWAGAALASPPSNAFRFVHDADGRLRAAIDPEGDTAVYEWDAGGNLLSIARHSSEELSILEVSPSVGDIGDTVEILGTGFSESAENDTVEFDGTKAKVTEATPWSLVVEVPAEATTGPVTVAVGEEGPVESPGDFTIGSTSKPNISSISPTIAAAGEEVTISGSSFDSSISGNVVTVNQSRPEVASASTGSIEFPVPSATLGGHVSVATVNGSDPGPDLYIPPNGIPPSKVDATGRFALNESTAAEITKAGDVGLKLFDGEAGQKVVFTLSESTFSGSVSIWGPRGTEVPGGATSFSKSGGGIVEPITLPWAGTYTALIQSGEGQTGSVKLTAYTLKDVTGSISPTKEGAKEKATITTPGQNALYSVEVKAGQGVSLKTSEASWNGEERYWLEWISPEGNVINSTYWWGKTGSGYWGQQKFTKAGTYTLKVNPAGAMTGSVGLTLWDSTDKTGDTITPTSEGESKTFSVDVPGQHTEITFSGTKEQQVSFVPSESSFGGYYNGTFNIYKPNGEWLSGSGGYLGEIHGPVTLPETGTYKIVLEGSGENTGSVKLTAYTLKDVTGSISPTKEGAKEKATITTPGQNALYSVEVKAGQGVSLKTSEASWNGEERYWLEWISPEGNVINSTYWWGKTGSGYWGQQKFTKAGTYTLKVNPAGAMTGSVGLTLWDSTDKTGDTITPTSEGESKTFSVDVPGQHTEITFSGTKEQQVSFVPSESSFGGYYNGTFNIYKPNGEWLSGSGGYLGEIHGPVTLPETGTYKIVLEGSGENTGSVVVKAVSGSDVFGSIKPTAEGAKEKATITTPGQNALYSVEVKAGQGVSLKTSEASWNGEERYWLEWISPEGNVINSTYWWGKTGSGYWGQQKFTKAGTYTLKVNPAGAMTGSVGLTLWDSTDKTGDTITPTSEGESKTFSVDVPGQHTEITFSGTKEQQVSFVPSESSFGGYYNGTFNIYKPNGEWLSGSGGYLGEIHGPVTLPETGTYKIVLEGSGENTGSVKLTAYTLKDVTGSISPTKEGAKEKATITTPGQNALYSVEVKAGQGVSLKTSEASWNGEERYWLEWISPEGNVINSTYWWGKTGSGYWGQQKFTKAGTYTLKVNPAGAMTGSVGLTLWDSTDKTGDTITPTSEGESKTFSVDVPGQHTEITFSGTKEQQVSFVPSESSFGGYYNGTFNIYKPNGEWLSGSGGYLGEIHGPVTLPETGTYKIVLEGSGENTGSVKLTAYTLKDVTGSISPTKEGAKEKATITTPGQNALYSVEVKAGQGVSLKTSEASWNGEERYWLEWISPEGNVINSTYWWGKTGSGYWGQQKFTKAGTYTLKVNPAGAMTGSVGLTLWDSTDKTGDTITPTSEGESKTFSVDVPGQHTEITFSGTKEQQVSFVPSESSFGGYYNGTFNIYKPNGEWLSGSGGYLGEIHGPVTLPETGTYKIVLEGSGENTGSVKLTAYLKGEVAWRGSFESTTQLVSYEIPTGDQPSPDPGVSSRKRADDARGSKPKMEKRAARKPKRHSRAHAKARSRSRDRSVATITAATRAFHPAPVKIWHPPRNVPGWEAAEPKTPWAKIVDLQAPSGTTALAGQALERNGLPLTGVRVSVEGTSIDARTDKTGRFLLARLPAGKQTLVVDGESVPGDRRYGSYEVSVDLANHKTTVLDYTIWLTPLDQAGDRRIASPTKRETRLTTSSIPGLEVRIPAGTTIRNAAGKAVKDLNITAVPVNQASFPLPPFVPIPVYFTIQPGRAYLSKGAQIIYPNWGNLRPGQRAEFWNYDPNDQGWYVYGRGTVSADGEQVVPDPGVRVWQFTGAMLAASPPPPEEDPTGTTSGDPVDLYSGLFTYNKRDLALPDSIPVDIQRTYRPADSNSYSFGVGTTNQYDMRLWSGAGAAEANLIMPDGQRIHYVRTTPGSGYADGAYESTSTPGPFYGSVLKYTPAGGGVYWSLELTNGMTYVFGVGRLMEVRDSHGNALVITRSGENMTKITSPHGRWVKFTYDESNRITELTDNGGRHVKYTYTSGRLTKVEGLGGRTTEYEYDGSGRMKAIINPRGNKYLQVVYDANGRVEKQTAGDGATFKFEYDLDEGGEVEATTVTDPLGSQHEVTFNAEGFSTSETEEPGTELEQTTSIERQAKTGLILSKTDPAGRLTEYEYDSVGNVTEATKLAGTEDAVTYKYEYEPGTANVTKIIDPLGHATKFNYGAHEELLSRVDPLGNETKFSWEGGQLTSITSPENEKTSFTYSGGDLVSSTDPLGRQTDRFVDSLGRVRSITSPGGQRTILGYSSADQVTSITAPSGAKTSIEYDQDGNPVTITDPRGNETTRKYDLMDRIEAETDPLGETAKWSYYPTGDLEAETDRNGDTTAYEFDPLRRLTKVSYGVSGEGAESTVEYEYDEANRPKLVQDSASGEYVLSFDGLNRPTAVASPQGTVAYAYDAASRREAMFVPGQLPVEYEFDAADHLGGLSRGGESVSLAYDKDGRLEGVTLPNGIEQLYGYDAAGQNTSITYKDGVSTLGAINYAYDPNGRTSATWGSYAQLDLPESLASAEYNEGNELLKREGETLEYDKNGHLTDDGASGYAWNARGELTGISGANEAAFEYDPFGRRVGKTLKGTTTEMLFDEANVVQESVESSPTGNLLTGLLADQLFARTTASGTSSYLTDRLGSVLGLVDEEGETTTSYSYEPFGAATSTGEGSDNPFQFTGRENDGTGLQFSRARYYDFSMGRFISRDPAGFIGSGTNLYRYVGANPLDFIDPSGECYVCIPNPIAPIENAVEDGANQVGEWVSGAPGVLSEVKEWGENTVTGAAECGFELLPPYQFESSPCHGTYEKGVEGIEKGLEKAGEFIEEIQEPPEPGGPPGPPPVPGRDPKPILIP